MKLFRLTTTLAAMLGLALASVYCAATASARVALDGHDTNAQLVPAPPVASTSSTSLWWFVLVAVGAAALTVVVMVTVRARRESRILPTTN